MNKIIIFLITTFCLFFFYDGNLSHFSERVYITSEAIMIFSIIMIFSNNERPYSLRKIFYLFTFFFFGIAPLVQFYNKTSIFNARTLSEYEYFHMNILILGILIIYHIFYLFFEKRNNVKSLDYIARLEIKKLTIKQSTLILSLSFISLLFVLYINEFNINRLLFRGDLLEGGENPAFSSSLNLIIALVIRPLPIICLMFYLLSPKKSIFLVIILFINGVIAVFPSGVARFYAAAVYIPLFIIVFKQFSKPNFFSLTFILGLLIIFPFLNSFRHYNKNTVLKFKLDFDMFNEGHFDSYNNFALIYFEDIVTWGRQLVGVLFFWVPRSIWPEKPIGSGFLLANKLNFSWTNVSANYFAEGYINFSYFGIFFFIVLLAYITSLLDSIYWKHIKKKNNFFKIVYLVLMGMIFFVMRGDLLSSTAFTMGFIGSIYIVFKFIHKKEYGVNY